LRADARERARTRKVLLLRLLRERAKSPSLRQSQIVVLSDDARQLSCRSCRPVRISAIDVGCLPIALRQSLPLLRCNLGDCIANGAA